MSTTIEINDLEASFIRFHWKSKQLLSLWLSTLSCFSLSLIYTQSRQKTCIWSCCLNIEIVLQSNFCNTWDSKLERTNCHIVRCSCGRYPRSHGWEQLILLPTSRSYFSQGSWAIYSEPCNSYNQYGNSPSRCY